MKKISITLAEDVVAGLNHYQYAYSSRSEQINAYLRAYLNQLQRADRDGRDLAIINANADKWNQKMEDFLDLQEQ